jgi:thiol-disulfide isomerase/thioredoxin
VKLHFAVAAVALALAATAVGSAAASELRPFSAGSWQQVLRDHAGRPSIVHFWGLTCGPCRVELICTSQTCLRSANSTRQSALARTGEGAFAASFERTCPFS